MGCTSSSASSAPKEKEEDPFEKRLREKREKNISEAKAKELPLLQPKGHRVVAAGTVGDNVRDNTGTSRLATQLKSTLKDATVENVDGVQFLVRAAVQRWQAKYDHFSPPAGFVCECRVSKRTEQWDWMTRTRCEQWCAFGDLTVREAEKINGRSSAMGDGVLHNLLRPGVWNAAHRQGLLANLNAIRLT